MNVTALVTGVIILVATATTASAQSALIGPTLPTVPPALEVPAGHQVYLGASAIGTQNYVCISTTSGFSWRFVGPQATLYVTVFGAPRQQVTTHFLSADPSGTARPTWQHSFDTSRVWGRVIASSSDPNYVSADAIPWLLLEASATATGPLRGDALARTTFIQRVNTAGGKAPSSGCSDVAHVGTQSLVPYTTDYFFYRAAYRQ